MGMGLVNLGNLKESMALPVAKDTYSQPVYIKAQSNQAQSKFIPGVFMTPQQQ